MSPACAAGSDSAPGRVTWARHPAVGSLSVTRSITAPEIQECPPWLLAGAAAGGFETIHWRFALGAESPVGRFSVLLFAGTVVESGVRIDPDREAGVSLKMDYGRGNLGDSERHERPFPWAERRRSRRCGCRPQEGQRGHEDGHSEIQVGAVKAQLHMPVRKALKHGARRGAVEADAVIGRCIGRGPFLEGG